MKMQAAICAAALAVTATAVVATPASAGFTTRCIGTGGAVTIPGDLVVPAGESCSLTGTVVEGSVRVQSGADLVVSGGTFMDKVVVAKDGYLDATQTTISGTLTSKGGYGVFLDRSELEGSYRGRDGGAAAPFAYLVNSQVQGAVDVRIGEVLLDTAKVGGQVKSAGNTFTDVTNSTLAGKLTVSENTEGAFICGSEVDGDVSYSANAGAQFGSGDLLSTCGDVNYFGGNVKVSDNTVGVSMSGNIVRGDLSGTGNDPAPTGSDNRVRGTVSGQFADLAPAATESKSASKSKLGVQRRVADEKGAELVRVRSNDVAAKVKDRRASAVEQAVEAGPANF